MFGHVCLIGCLKKGREKRSDSCFHVGDRHHLQNSPDSYCNVISAFCFMGSASSVFPHLEVIKIHYPLVLSLSSFSSIVC